MKGREGKKKKEWTHAIAGAARLRLPAGSRGQNLPSAERRVWQPCPARDAWKTGSAAEARRGRGRTGSRRRSRRGARYLPSLRRLRARACAWCRGCASRPALPPRGLPAASPAVPKLCRLRPVPGRWQPLAAWHGRARAAGASRARPVAAKGDLPSVPRPHTRRGCRGRSRLCLVGLCLPAAAAAPGAAAEQGGCEAKSRRRQGWHVGTVPRRRTGAAPGLSLGTRGKERVGRALRAHRSAGEEEEGRG